MLACCATVFLSRRAFGHHELDVLAGDEDLLEAVLDAADAVGHEGEAGAVEDGFLHPGDEAEAQVLADLADLPEEVQVENEILVLAGAQIIEQFIDHQEQAVIRVLLVEGEHHRFEGTLVVRHLVYARKSIAHAERGQVLLKLCDYNIPQ
jgi:hypothetical protein